MKSFWGQRSLRVVMCALVAVASARCVGAQSASKVPMAPQNAQQSGTPALRVTSRLVLLDVTVTDKAGRPVTDLKKEDFAVYEDKVAQRMVSFESPAVHVLPGGSGAGAFDAEDAKSFGQSPVTVLVLDELNTHFEDSSFAVRSVRQFLESRPAVLAQPTTLMVVADNRFHVLQGFTRDRDTLLKALNAQPVHYAWKLEGDKSIGYGAVERLDQSLSALEQIAQSTARIAGRKNLVWVGQGFPSLDPTELATQDADTVKNTIQHVTNVLLDTRVTLYAVDPTTSAAGMTEITDPTQLEFAQAAGDGFARNAGPFSTDLDFDRLGPVTGGRVIRSMNDVDKQIADSVEMGAQFYTIGYAPSSESEYRNIRVVCLRPGLTVTTRNGYYAAAPSSESAKTTLIYDLNMAAVSEVPLTGLKVTAEPARSGAANTWTVYVDASTLRWQGGANGVQTARVVVMAVGLSAKGKIVTHTLQSMTATAKSGVNPQRPGETATFAIVSQPEKGVARLRFVVRDSAAGAMGTFDMPVEH